MKWLAAPLAAGLLACAALAQEEAVETRRFAVGFLTSRPADTDSWSLGLAQDAIGTAVVVGAEAGAGPVGPDGLVELLRKEVAPGSWDAEGNTLRVDAGGFLTATNRRAALEAVGAWLARARARHARRIAVDAALVVVPFDRWGRLEPRELQAVSKVLHAGRVFAAPGARVHTQELAQLSYVRDYDVQIGTSAAALDPIVDVLHTGARIDLCAWPGPSGGRIVFDIRAEAAAYEGMDDRTLKLQVVEGTGDPAAPPATKAWEGLVQLPRTSFDRFRGRASAKPGETVIAASASRPDGMLALLLTPAFAADGPAAPADPPGAFRKIYEVQGIAARVHDWPAPRPALASPVAGGGGPLTGATFTLDEPREGYSLEALSDDLERFVGKKNVEAASGLNLAVRATAEQHAQVEALLTALFEREARVLTTEVALVAFKAGARAEWAKTVAALAPGGSRSPEAAVAALLEEARKGGPVRLAAGASIGGRASQRVHLVAGRQQGYVQDFEPQVSASAACYDPIIGVLLTGLGLEATPNPRADDGATDLVLKAWLTAGELIEEKKLTTGGGPLQRARVSGPAWTTEVVCLPGHWTLAALETRGEEDLALFVRVR